MPPLDIPADFPLDALIGQEVTQVCIGQHDVHLNFYKRSDASPQQKWEPGARIDIESGFELKEVGGRTQSAMNDVLGANSGCLTILLGRSVETYERLGCNELLLGFSGDVTLLLRTDPTGFESYHLLVEGESVDVTFRERNPDQVDPGTAS